MADSSGGGAPDSPEGAPPPLRLPGPAVGYAAAMSENPQQPDTDVPHEDELDVEAPNESAPGHNPPDDDEQQSDA
jgi:hypothetical protein